jgi:electron transfer flavoprotein alpha subunit
MSVLVIAEHRRGELRTITRELVTAGQDLGLPVIVAVIGAELATHTEALKLPGVDEIVTVEVARSEFEADVYRDAVQAVIAAREPRVVLTGFTVDGMGYAPAVAARLGMGFASDVFALRRDGDDLVATRAFYRGKVFAEVGFTQPQVMLMLRPGTWPEASGDGDAQVTSLAVEARPSRARHERFVDLPSNGRVDVSTADLILSLGRGVGEQESLGFLERLAEKMGATLCASRPLVDAGWVSSEHQVGQSGKTVRPKVYLALGVSGAVQHLAGMKSSETIIAVNLDSKASIFNVAHYGAVADLHDVAEELDRLY